MHHVITHYVPTHHVITPMTTPIDTKAYRQTIGLFATGVTVLLAEREGEVRGMTANAVTSLSLEPTLVIVCPSKRANLAAYLTVGSAFTINILNEDQEPLSNFFAGGWRQEQEPEYAFVPWGAAEQTPRLEGCLASLACRVHQVHDGGDHWIVVGEVLDLHRSAGVDRPLVFFSGKYHNLRRQEPEHIQPSADAWK